MKKIRLSIAQDVFSSLNPLGDPKMSSKHEMYSFCFESGLAKKIILQRRSHKTVGINQGFSWIDPDPGGPKTYGSGSTTLLKTMNSNKVLKT
jgi:hypothetical protein